MDEVSEPRFTAGRSKRLNVSHANTKTIVRHSRGGISRVRSDSAGQVAQSGIASPPIKVHTRGDKGLRWLEREFNVPKRRAVWVVISTPPALLRCHGTTTNPNNGLHAPPGLKQPGQHGYPRHPDRFEALRIQPQTLLL